MPPVTLARLSVQKKVGVVVRRTGLARLQQGQEIWSKCSPVNDYDKYEKLQLQLQLQLHGVRGVGVAEVLSKALWVDPPTHTHTLTHTLAPVCKNLDIFTDRNQAF